MASGVGSCRGSELERGRGHRIERVEVGQGRDDRVDRAMDHVIEVTAAAGLGWARPSRAMPTAAWAPRASDPGDHRAGYAQFAFIAMGTPREALRTRVVLQRTGTATARPLGNVMGWIGRIVPRAMAHGHEPMVLPGPTESWSERLELGQDLAPDRLEMLGIVDVDDAEDDVLGAGVGQLAEPVDDLAAASRGRGGSSGGSSARSRRSSARPPRSARAGPRTCGGSARGRRRRSSRRRTGRRGGASSARRRRRS